MRLDGDMYESTMQALERALPRGRPGGFCIIDDYGAVPACAEAIEDFREKHQITEPLEQIDWAGVYWRKA